MWLSFISYPHSLCIFIDFNRAMRWVCCIPPDKLDLDEEYEQVLDNSSIGGDIAIHDGMSTSNSTGRDEKLKIVKSQLWTTCSGKMFFYQLMHQHSAVIKRKQS